MTTEQHQAEQESKANPEESKNRLKKLLNAFQHANYQDDKAVRGIIRTLEAHPDILEVLPDSTEYAPEQKKSLIIALASAASPLPEDLQDTLSHQLSRFPSEENYENSKKALRGKLLLRGWDILREYIERLQSVQTLEQFRQALTDLNVFLEEGNISDLSSREFDSLFDQFDRLFEELSEKQPRAAGSVEPGDIASRLEINREMERLYGFLLGRQIISV